MKLKALLTTLLAMSLAGGASAAANMSWIGVQSGASIPTGDLADFTNTGLYVAGHYGYPLTDLWTVGADLGWHKWGKVQGIELSSIQYAATMKFTVPTGDSNVRPYAKAGVGAYSTLLKGDRAVTDPGFQLAGGIAWMAYDRMQWGLEGAYHYISSEGDAATMITVGLVVAWGVGAR